MRETFAEPPNQWTMSEHSSLPEAVVVVSLSGETLPLRLSSLKSLSAVANSFEVARSALRGSSRCPEAMISVPKIEERRQKSSWGAEGTTGRHSRKLRKRSSGSTHPVGVLSNRLSGGWPNDAER